ARVGRIGRTTSAAMLYAAQEQSATTIAPNTGITHAQRARGAVRADRSFGWPLPPPPNEPRWGCRRSPHADGVPAPARWGGHEPNPMGLATGVRARWRGHE